MNRQTLLRSSSNFRRTALIISCLGLLTACAHIPDHSATVPPVQVPVPAIDSALPITLTNVDLSRLVTGLPIPDHIQKPDNPHYDFYAWATGECGAGQWTCTWILDDGELGISANWRGNAGASALFGISGCNLDPVFPGAWAQVEPYLKEEGDKWSLGLHGTVNAYLGPGSDTKCTILNIGVAGIVNSALGGASQSLTNKVNSLSVPVPVGDVLSRARGPFRFKIDDAIAACLYPNITGVSLGRLQGANFKTINNDGTHKVAPLNAVSVPLLLTAKPSLLLTSADCPSLLSSTAVVARTPALNEPFRVLTQVAVDYASLSSIGSAVAQDLVGHYGFFSRAFSAESVSVMDAQGQVLVAVTFKGALDGTVYFWGTPVLSRDGKMLSIPNLDLAVESRHALLGIKASLPTVITDLLRQPLQQKLVFDVGKASAQLHILANKQTVFPGGTLSLGNLDIRSLDVRATPSTVLVDVVLSGTASATVTDIPKF